MVAIAEHTTGVWVHTEPGLMILDRVRLVVICVRITDILYVSDTFKCVGVGVGVGVRVVRVRVRVRVRC